MGGFPNINIPPPATSGGVSQYFSSSNPNSWFPGAPQFNMSMSRMLGDYGSNDAELAQLMGGYDAYGRQLQKQAIGQGIYGSTQARDQLAAQYGASAVGQDKLAGEGLEDPTGGGALAKYGADLMGTTGINAQAQRAAGDVPGQIALQKQAVQNAYRQQQMKSLSQMINLAAQAAGSQFGYQSAQLGADRGQIQLDNAQNQEAMSNLSGMMSMLFGNQIPSLFGGGPSSAFGPMGQGGGFLQNWLGSGAGAAAGAGAASGGTMTAADFGSSLAEAAPMFFAA